MACAAAARRSLPNASRAASAVARSVDFCVSREAGGLDIHHRHAALSHIRSSSPAKAVIQYSSTFVMESRSRDVLDTPLEPVIGLAEGETRWRSMTGMGRIRRQR